MHHATWHSLFLEASKSKKNRIFGFFMKNYTFLPMAKKFGQVLSPQKVKKHSKNDLTTPILTHRKKCWENGRLGGGNGGQIETFHLGWKVDRWTFLTSTLGAHLDNGKASKSGSK